MILSVKKCPEKDFRPYIKRAAIYYSEILIPSKKLRNHISVDVKFENMDVWGMAYIDDYNASNKPRHFHVLLHKHIGAANILKTLAHEMVHVKQFLYGETNETLSVWRGLPINSDEVDYYFQPWEIEANGLQESLFAKFVIKEKLWNVFDGIYDPDAPIEKQTIKWKNNENSIVTDGKSKILN